LIVVDASALVDDAFAVGEINVDKPTIAGRLPA